MVSNLLIKSTYRSKLEQFIGLMILFVFSIAINVICSMISDPSLFQKSIPKGIYNPIWSTLFTCISLSFWLLWRRQTLRKLKLEASLISSQYLFIFLWNNFLFVLKTNLLALTSILFLGSSLLIMMAIFYKKEKLSGYILIPYALWVFYLTWNNMLICSLNY